MSRRGKYDNEFKVQALKLKKAEKPYDKCATDITEIPAKDGKIYVSELFDCYSLRILGLEMRDNMKADLCI